MIMSPEYSGLLFCPKVYFWKEYGPMKVLCFWMFVLCTLGAKANPDSLLQVPATKNPRAYVNALVAIPYDQFVSDLPRAAQLVAKADSALPKGKWLREEVALRRLQALVSQYSGQYEAAMGYQQACYDLYRQLKDTLNMARTLSGMGYISKRRDLDQGLKWMEEGKAMMLQIGHEEHLAELVNNLGVLYEMKGDLDKAMEHYQWSLRLVKKFNDSIGMPYTLEHISGIYFYRSDFKEALRLLDEAYRWRLMRADSNGLGQNLANQIEVHYAAGNHQKATQFAAELVRIAQRVGNPDLVRHAYKIGAQAYAAMGAYKDAWEWEAKHRVMHDSLFNERNNARILDLEKKYELARREEENQRLKEQTAQQQLALLQARRNRDYLLFGGAIVVLVLSLLYAAMYLRQQKRLAAREQELEKQRFRLVLQGEEKERSRLARELHDGLGQLLAAAKLQLGLAVSGDRPAFEKAQVLLEETVLEVRHISHNLMPMSLSSKGLSAALQQLFDKVQAPGKLELEVHMEADFTSFDLPEQTAIYRVVQEVLHNMVKHAEASRIVIDIQQDGDELLLSIADNGKGFDTEQIKQSKGMGWENLYTRVGLLNGNLEVNSKPGRGTLVFAGIPLPKLAVAA